MLNTNHKVQFSHTSDARGSTEHKKAPNWSNFNNIHSSSFSHSTYYISVFQGA